MTESIDPHLIDCDENKVICGLKINPSQFRLLCDNVQNCLSEIDQSMFELVELKDKLLLQYLPRSVLLNITLVFSRFYRAYSQSQIPISELIRLVQLYIEPFDMKCEIFKRLYESNEMKKRMLHSALNKLTSVDQQSKQYEEQKILSHWEKMYIRSATTRGNIRLWKFRIKTFREKASLGYEQVMIWIRTGIVRSVGDARVMSSEEKSEEPLEINEEIDREKSPIDQITHDDENVVEESDKEVIETTIETVDVDIQAQPDYDHQQTSTEDALSTRSLILRIYRPIGIAKTKFQSIIYVHQRTYPTKSFLYHKSPVRTVTNNRMTKGLKRVDISTDSEKDDINTIDIQQADELIIPMVNALTRRSLFETDIDPDAMKIEIYADEKLQGSLIFSSEDLRMLDLPTLHNPIFSPFITFVDNPFSENVLRFDQPSNQLYQLWISRRPPTYSIYNHQNQVIGKLPLWMFWYEKFENKFVTKGTMTEPMEIRLPTPRMEIFISSTPGENLKEISSDDQLEIIKASYENEISRLHEAYQTEIHRLTTLIHEASSTQMTEQSRYNSNASTIKIEHQQSKRPFSSSIPKTFLDRYEMYLEKSILHRHQLSAKVERETALANERQMEIQHRLYKPQHDIQFDDDLCLPAVFMPFQSGHVFNPRAYQYFHPTGSSASRLTQPPSIPKFPSLPHRSYSVLNLFELSRTHEKTRSTTTTAQGST